MQTTRILAAAVFSVLALPSHGAAIAMFDFGQNSAETGFTKVSGAQAASGATVGGVTVTFTPTAADRDRNNINDSGLFTYDRMLETFIQGQTQTEIDNGALDVLTLTGLVATNTYQVQIWAHDSSFNPNGQFLFNSTVAGASGSVANANGSSAVYANNNAYSFKTATFTGVTSISWNVDILDADTNARTHLNGLVVFQVPEPSSLALSGLAALAMLTRRRR